MPLEGAEEGEGNFLGSICSQVEALGGNLDPSETTMQKSRTKIRQCLQEPDIWKFKKILICSETKTVSRLLKTWALHWVFDGFSKGDMLRNARRLPTSLLE